MDTTIHTVLVVQSDYTLRRAIESVLASSGGYRVIATGDPDAAYDVLSVEAVDAILVDADLPTISGPALYLAMIHRWPELKDRIAILADDVQAEQLRRWLQHNPCTVIRKPFRFEPLAHWLEGAVHTGATIRRIG
jgi:DNA-binding NarL/FixJ family response regulator